MIDENSVGKTVKITDEWFMRIQQANAPKFAESIKNGAEVVDLFVRGRIPTTSEVTKYDIPNWMALAKRRIPLLNSYLIIEHDSKFSMIPDRQWVYFSEVDK